MELLLLLIVLHFKNVPLPRVALPVAFQNPEDSHFTPGPAPFLPSNTAPAEIGFIDFNFAGEGR